MFFLLTFGVIAYQLAIVATIMVAGAIGRKTLWFVTAGWVVFTLFGSIHTSGLLMLQLGTILISYNIGKRRRATKPSAAIQNVSAAPGRTDDHSDPTDRWLEVLARSELENPKLGTDDSTPGIFARPGDMVAEEPSRSGLWQSLMIVIGLLLLGVIFFGTKPPARAPAPASAAESQSRNAFRIPQTNPSSADGHSSTSNVARNKDLRSCLSLETNEAIARCAERGR